MSWLDNCIAIPTCGIDIVPNFFATPKYPEIFAPLLTKIYEENEKVICDYDKQIQFVINSPDGYVYTFSSSKMLVGYRYFQQEEKVAGGFPELVTPDTIAYSELLEYTILKIKSVIEYYSAD